MFHIRVCVLKMCRLHTARIYLSEVAYIIPLLYIYFEIRWDGINRILTFLILDILWIINAGEMSMDARNVDWDPFIVACGPTIVCAALILSELLADCAVDTESDLTHKDRATF